ncbi:MAG: hypothetical protein QM760_15945 [Nibricoccus sp.]
MFKSVHVFNLHTRDKNVRWTRLNGVKRVETALKNLNLRVAPEVPDLLANQVTVEPVAFENDNARRVGHPRNLG